MAEEEHLTGAANQLRVCATLATMEFTYRISEADYLAAANLQRRDMRKGPVKAVMFWVFILVCLFTLWSIVSNGGRQSNSNSSIPNATSSEGLTTGDSPQTTGTSSALLFNVGPFLLLILVWIILVFWLGPIRLRSQYRIDPSVHGEITVNITPESLSSPSTAGVTSQSGWNIYKRWVEERDLVLLVRHSPIYVILNIAGLTDGQRAELRGILSTALPKK